MKLLLHDIFYAQTNYRNALFPPKKAVGEMPSYNYLSESNSDVELPNLDKYWFLDIYVFHSAESIAVMT